METTAHGLEVAQRGLVLVVPSAPVVACAVAPSAGSAAGVAVPFVAVAPDPRSVVADAGAPDPAAVVTAGVPVAAGCTSFAAVAVFGPVADSLYSAGSSADAAEHHSGVRHLEAAAHCFPAGEHCFQDEEHCSLAANLPDWSWDGERSPAEPLLDWDSSEEHSRAVLRPRRDWQGLYFQAALPVRWDSDEQHHDSRADCMARPLDVLELRLEKRLALVSPLPEVFHD